MTNSDKDAGTIHHKLRRQVGARGAPVRKDLPTCAELSDAAASRTITATAGAAALARNDGAVGFDMAALQLAGVLTLGGRGRRLRSRIGADDAVRRYLGRC